MIRKILVLPVLLMIFSCENESPECACYEAAIDGKETTEECEEFVKDLSEEELKEKSNECFADDIEDLSGAGGH